MSIELFVIILSITISICGIGCGLVGREIGYREMASNDKIKGRRYIKESFRNKRKPNSMYLCYRGYNHITYDIYDDPLLSYNPYDHIYYAKWIKTTKENFKRYLELDVRPFWSKDMFDSKGNQYISESVLERISVLNFALFMMEDFSINDTIYIYARENNDERYEYFCSRKRRFDNSPYHLIGLGKVEGIYRSDHDSRGNIIVARDNIAAGFPYIRVKIDKLFLNKDIVESTMNMYIGIRQVNPAFCANISCYPKASACCSCNMASVEVINRTNDDELSLIKETIDNGSDLYKAIRLERSCINAREYEKDFNGK